MENLHKSKFRLSNDKAIIWAAPKIQDNS